MNDRSYYKCPICGNHYMQYEKEYDSALTCLDCRTVFDSETHEITHINQDVKLSYLEECIRLNQQSILKEEAR